MPPGVPACNPRMRSTLLYDAGATMDTVTLVRWAIRGLLKAAGPELTAGHAARVRRQDPRAAHSLVAPHGTTARYFPAMRSSSGGRRSPTDNAESPEERRGLADVWAEKRGA